MKRLKNIYTLALTLALRVLSFVSAPLLQLSSTLDRLGFAAFEKYEMIRNAIARTPAKLSARVKVVGRSSRSVAREFSAMVRDLNSRAVTA